MSKVNSAMANSWSVWYWHLGLASLLTTGGPIAGFRDCAFAQSSIVPDSTLGVESSVVTPTNINGFPSDQIDGGAIRGENLFHSFQEFNLGEGRGAYFTNPTGIENILSRVTGGSRSDILGRLGVLGNANLFLINPNGIIFGPNASLDIGGSFVATTANAIQFAEQGFFSASAPNVPPLLTVNPSAFLFNQIAEPITNQSVGGLQVLESQSLLLLGGNVSLESGGVLNAPGGRVELGGVAGAGMVGLNVDGSNLRLTFPSEVTRADVSLTNGSEVNVRAGGGGSIAINAQNLNIAGGSRLRAGIASGLGSVDSKAGNIEINGTGAINLTNESFIANTVLEEAVGKGGDINVTAGSLSVTNGALLNTATYGQGDAGSVTINASDTVSFDGGNVFNIVDFGAVGNSGGINITTSLLSLTNGARLEASTYGKGNAGSVIIDARNTVSLDGVDSDGNASVVLSKVDEEAKGQGGDVRISTGSLSLTNGAGLQSSTFGQGNAGSVIIDARNTVSLDGRRGRFRSAASSQVGKVSRGQGGDIQISTGLLFVTNDALLSTSTLGQGNAGSIIIDARDRIYFRDSRIFNQVGKVSRGQGGDIQISTGLLFVTDASLNTSTFGQGNAGSIIIDARDTVSFDEVDSKGAFDGAFSEVEGGAVGNGGDINITTGSLSLTSGAKLRASTFGQGDAGNVTITASDVIAYGVNSGAFSNVGDEGVGKGGGINITTGSLSVTNGAQLLASTFGQGDAGNVTITASDTIAFDGVGSNGFSSGTFSTVESGAVGKGGSVNITTGSLEVTNGAGLFAYSEGNGVAGNIQVAADSIRLDNQGQLSSDTTGGQGNIFLRSRDLVLRRESFITTDATGTATGGNITIDADVIVALENSDITANASEGPGGRIRIDAQGIFGTEYRNQLTPLSDITATSNLGPEFSGTVEINTPDVDPSQGLATLPAQLVEASGLIAAGCAALGESKFIVTGRGGLPENPTDPLSSDAVQVDLVTLNPREENRSSPSVSTNPTAPAPLVEAQGWLINNKGEVVLTAQAPNVTSYIPWMNPATCHTP